VPVLAALAVVAVLAGATPALADEPTTAPSVAVRALDGTPGTLAVTWDATGDATSYDVVVGDVHRTVADTQLVVSGLADNTAYDVSVAPLNAVGLGPETHVTGLTVPAAPSLKVLTGNAVADLAWTAADGLDGFDLTTPSGVLALDGAARSQHVTGLTNGVPSRFALVARNAGGASAPAIVSAIPRAPARLVVLTQAAPSVVYGTRSVVRAALRLGDVPVAGEALQLLANGKQISTAKTDASGNASLSALLPANATLVVRHTDTAVSARDVAARAVRVAPKLTRVGSAASIRVGTVLTLRGALAPARAKGALVQLQRYTTKGWAAVANGRMTSTTVYSLSWRPTAAGAAMMRVVTPPDAAHAMGATPYWRQTVRLENAVDVARDILADRSIVLEAVHSGGPTDRATPLEEMRSIAAGQAARRSSFGTAPGGSTRVDLRLLKALRRMGQLGSVRVSEIAGGSHAGHSQHYLGKAIDINYVNGRHVGSGSSYSMAVSACRAFGAARVFNPGYDPYGGHGNHVHCDWY
jgi:hypothetical protein